MLHLALFTTLGRMTSGAAQTSDVLANWTLVFIRKDKNRYLLLRSRDHIDTMISLEKFSDLKLPYVFVLIGFRSPRTTNQKQICKLYFDRLNAVSTYVGV